jgi:arylamine N-acetyltransferase
MDDSNPLAPPRDQLVLQRYLQHFGLSAECGRRELLERILRAFAVLPYENLSKIIKQAAQGGPRHSKRLPIEVVQDHVRFGTGGTCFSLTAALLHLLRAAGWEAQPILADRAYGPNTHCALLVWIDGMPHLVDPGYLIVKPLPLGAQQTHQVRTDFNELILQPQAGGDKLDLATVERAGPRYRLTFKTSPVDAAEFLNAWDESFAWDMMRYPVLTRVAAEQQLYLRGTRLQTRGHHASHSRQLPPGELAAWIAREFGIQRELAERALAILHGRGEPLP